MAGPSRHRATAVFQAPSCLAAHRRSLLDFLWLRQREGQWPDRWELDAPAEDILRVSAEFEGADEAGACIANLASEFVEAERRAASEAGEALSDLEILLAELIGELDLDLSAARTALTQLRQATPNDDPFAERETIGDSLAAATRTLGFLRSTEEEVIASLKRLDTTPLPSQGRVDPQLRAAAMADREDLQQDLKQLTMQLTLARQQIEQVWQQASPRLDELLAAADRIDQILNGDASRAAEGPEREALDRIAGRFGPYQRRLQTFARQWTETLTRMDRQPVDPLSPRLFDTHGRLTDLLGGFSYHTGKVLDDIAEAVRGLDEVIRDAARYHRLNSEVRRAFHRLEVEHRRFEFVASDVWRRNNFRLDAALGSASGLHLGIQRGVSAIDGKLKDESLAGMLAERSTARQHTLDEIERIRREIYEAIDEVLGLQGEFRETIADGEEALRGAHAQALADSRLAMLEERRGRLQERLDELIQQRRAEPPSPPVRIVECSVDPRPTGLRGRLLRAVAVALVAFVGLLAVQRR